MDGEFTDILDRFLSEEGEYDGLVGSFSDIRAHIAAIDASRELAAHDVLHGAQRSLSAFHDDMTSYLIGLAGNSEYRGHVRRLFRKHNAELVDEWAEAERSARSALSAVRAKCREWFPGMDWGTRGSDDGSAEYLVLSAVDSASRRLDAVGSSVLSVLEAEVAGIVDGWDANA